MKPTHRRQLAIFFAFQACLALGGCTTPNRVKVEAPPNYQAPQPTPIPQLPRLPAKETEVQQTARRIFKDAAVIREPVSESFTVGDFNGDGSQDVAIIVKPASGKVGELNQEYPPWIISDLRNGPNVPSRQARIEDDELLLAVIHGNGVNDWRDQEATQTFLLKSAVGTGLRSQPMKEFLAANAGRRLPLLQGDLLAEVLRGSPGYIYYGGATYFWFDPKNYRDQPEKRFVHMNQRQVARR